MYQDTRSNIVFSCLHTDHTEHDVDIIVTEHGVADLRGLSSMRRPHEIISKCAAPQFQEELFSQMGKIHIKIHILIFMILNNHFALCRKRA